MKKLIANWKEIIASIVFVGAAINWLVLPKVKDIVETALIPIKTEQRETKERMEYFTRIFIEVIPDSTRNRIAKEFYEAKGKQ